VLHRVEPVVGLEGAVIEYAHALAERAPMSIEGAWLAIQLALDPSNAGLKREFDALEARAADSRDYREGIAAFRTGRLPRFDGS
jgi:enoyl-CoA hydratase/carnithine racemase